MFFLRRLLPFIEKRVNLIELAPKGTGKSYIFEKISKRGLAYQWEYCIPGLPLFTIIGMAAALQKNVDHLGEDQSKLLSLEQTIIDKLDLEGIKFHRNGVEPRVPGNRSLSFPGMDGEALLHRFDLTGSMVSTGSACDSKNTQISHVLKAIKADEQYAKGTIRISLGRDNTVEEAEKISEEIIRIAGKKR